jgi:ankyrin repeat protein
MPDDARRLIRAFLSSTEQGLGMLKEEPGLISSRDGLGETPLHYLCVENHLEAVRALIRYGSEVNTVNNCGGTPLSEAASLGYTDLVAYLLSVGAKLWLQGQTEPSIHEAVRGGSLEIVKMLIHAGADVNTTNDLMETPLHIAAQEDKNIEIVRLLVASGANINATRIFDQTPLQVAEENGATHIAAQLTRSSSA